MTTRPTPPDSPIPPPIPLGPCYVTLAVVLAGMLGLMFYAYATGRRMVSLQAPLVYAAKQIQIETISGHLWFEEVLHGERSDALDGVWDHYRQAVGYAEAMLQGGASPEGRIQPLDEPALRQQIAELKSRFTELEEVTRRRFAEERSPHPPGALQDQYHHLFHQLMHAAGNVEEVMADRIEAELQRFRLVHLVLVIAGSLGTGLVGFLFLSFERRTTEQFRVAAAARREAAESEGRFRTLFEHVTDPLYVCDLEGRVVDGSQRACEALGYTRDELLALRVSDIEVGHTEPEMAGVKSRLAPGASALVEGVHRRKDGSTFPVEVHLQRFEWEGRPVVIGIARDLTERKRALESLRQSEQWYQSLAEVSPVGIFRTDVDGACVYVNCRWAKIAGLDPAAAWGDGWARAIHPEDRERVVKEWQGAVRDGRPFRMEYRFLSPAGVTTWVIGGTMAVRGPGGEVVGHVGTVTDISERKRMEDELRAAKDDLEVRVQERTASLRATNARLEEEIAQREKAEESLRYSEAKYSTLVENSPSGVFIYRDGRFVFVNPALVAMTGYDADELLTMDVSMLAHPDDRAWVRETARRRLAGESAPSDYELRFVTRAGETRWSHIRTALIQYRGGLSTLASVTDVTERKRMSEALQTSQEELRRLSGEILLAQEEERARIARELHDSIGQSLSAIKFHVESVIPRCSGADSGEQPLRAVVVRVQETVEEVRRISMALRPSILDDLGLVATIGWHCRQFQGHHPGIQVTRDLEIQEEEVPERLKIVIFRILQEAMSNAGEHSGAGAVEVTVWRQGGLLELRVSDDGRGIDLGEVEGRPPSVRGYGLGSMRERAEMSGGKLSIELPDGGGTVIRATWDLERAVSG